MNKKLKLILTSLIVLIVLSAVWFNFFFLVSNTNLFEKQLESLGKNSDIIIIFNSGGWGTISFEKAFDFNPVINNIKGFLENQNYRVSIVPYYRTEGNFWGRIGSMWELAMGYPNTSKNLANKVDNFLKENPNKKIVIAGLSNGASLVDSMMKDIGSVNNVVALEFGTPFSNYNKARANNVLVINNNHDVLAQGEILPLVGALVKSPFVYLDSVFHGKYISYSEAVKINGHSYPWSQVQSEIVSFLKTRIN